LRPTRGMKLNGTGALDEEHAQIAIATLGDASKYRAVPGRHLLWHQAKPRGEVAPFSEGGSIADRGHGRAGNDRADARNGHQLPTTDVGLCQAFDLIGDPFDSLIEVAPVVNQVTSDPDHTWR